MMDENTKVMDDVRTPYAIVSKSVGEADICDDTADAIFREVRGEQYEFGLIWIGFEAVLSKPSHDL